MKQLRYLRHLILGLALAGSLHAQLVYTSSLTAISPFTAMKADTPFVNSTLLNLGSFTMEPDNDGQIHSFVYGGLTFNNIPNLDPSPPSDLQVGPGFFADVVFIAKDSADNNNIGSESSLLGIGNQTLYPSYGPSSSLTWHITAATPTDLIFWHQDLSLNSVKYTMDDVRHWTTFEAIDLVNNRRLLIFGNDDRGALDVASDDFDDAVFGVSMNIQPVGVLEPVPEPGTYGMLGAGALLGIVVFYRNKRKAAALG